eukprot:4471860-Prymnesium_polylepis.2
MPLSTRPLLPPVYRVTEQMEKSLRITLLPKRTMPFVVPWSASTGTDVPWPLMLAADSPHGDSVAALLLPEASIHVWVCRSNSPCRYHAIGEVGKANGWSGGREGGD